MKDLIATNSLNLIDSHVFQFDFLNDDFSKLPQSLQDIINDPEKRKKLVIYINPPYAEAGDSKQLSGTGKNKTDVAVKHLTYEKYLSEIGLAGRELFAQFFIRIYHELHGCVLAEFSKLKALQATNFVEYRKIFQAKLCSLFLVPASTFDNVKGSFPIGFFIWYTAEKEKFTNIIADVYNAKGVYDGKKSVYCYDETMGNIGKWVATFKDEKGSHIGFMSNGRNDFQNQKLVYIMNEKNQMPTPRGWWITPKNLIPMCIFLAVRHSIDATWLNDRDQFLYPEDSWVSDEEFQSDCLAFTLFNNNIQMSQGTNHWIPFTEEEVGAHDMFESHFMTDYISGKNRPAPTADLFSEGGKASGQAQPIVFSAEATAVMDAGRELWRYYHKQPFAKPNAAFYDIRLHFQGTNAKGNMNPGSTDEEYTRLIKNLRACLKTLAKKIEPKVYKHGFLIQ